MSFKFYTSITGLENLKYLHRVFFQNFTSLLSESSVSKEDSEEMEVNKRKRKHGSWSITKKSFEFHIAVTISPAYDLVLTMDDIQIYQIMMLWGYVSICILREK